MRQKYIIYTNIDKIMKIKMIKNILTSTNTWQQKLLSKLTYSSNNKLLMYIENNKGPKINLLGTAGRISAQDKHWPFKTTFCFLSPRKSSKILIISPQLPFWRSLNIFAKLSKLWRYQGISHELRALYQNHLRFHG